MGRDSGKQKKENMKALSPEQEAGLKQKAEEISKGLQSYTWRDLETGGKFTHNDKLTFIRDDIKPITWKQFDWLMSGLEVEQPKALKMDV